MANYRHSFCNHYLALATHAACVVGVNYRQTFGQGRISAMPCFGLDPNGPGMIPCALRAMPTPEEVATKRVEMEARTKYVIAAIQLAVDWREKPTPAAHRRSVVKCPKCQGRLHLFQSAHNGHVSARCETDGCLAWME